MITTANDTDTDTDFGFEISIDEAVYLVRHLNIDGLMPDVLALHTTTAEHLDLGRLWALYTREYLIRRGIIDPKAGVQPQVARFLHHIAAAEATICAMLVPQHLPDTMLCVVIACREGKFAVASRSREVLLVQPVIAADWCEATMKVIDALLGSAPRANLSTVAQLSNNDLEALASQPPDSITDYLQYLGINRCDAKTLLAPSETSVTALLSAARRDQFTTRKSKAMAILRQTSGDRILAWTFSDLEQQTKTNFAAYTPDHLATVIELLFEELI